MSTFLKSGTGKIVIGVLVIVGIMVGILVFQPGGGGSDLDDINILTRHDVAIQNSFIEAFLESSYAQDLGYTVDDEDKINFLSVSTLQGWEQALSSETRAIDLAWGGGPTLFNQMAERNLLEPITDPELIQIVEDNVPEEIAGAEMRQHQDGDLIWVANAISSFGFTVNSDKLEDLNLPKPTTWSELASPDFFRGTEIPVVSLGNPTQTTSNTRIYQIIIQKFGWEKGWELLSRMAGNGAIYGGSVATRSAIIDGEVAVGMTIDFYGVFAQADCEDKQTSCEYIIPTNGSIVNGDPIAFGINGVVEGAEPENEEASNGAKAFFKFVNSEEGQAVWVANDRLPINVEAFNTELGQTRTDVKELYDETLANQGIEFNETLSAQVEFTLQNYFDSAITAPHTELRNAWGKAVTALQDGDITQQQFDQQISDLFAPQWSLEETIEKNERLIDDSAFLLETKGEWEETALERYNAYSPTSFLNLDESNLVTIKNVDSKESPTEYSLNYILIPLIKKSRVGL